MTSTSILRDMSSTSSGNWPLRGGLPDAYQLIISGGSLSPTLVTEPVAVEWFSGARFVVRFAVRLVGGLGLARDELHQRVVEADPADVAADLHHNRKSRRLNSGHVS